jgi:RNA recognition motif-containing protein
MDPCNLYVGFVSPDVGQRELSDLFSSCGEVADCKLIMDR